MIQPLEPEEAAAQNAQLKPGTWLSHGSRQHPSHSCTANSFRWDHFHDVGASRRPNSQPTSYSRMSDFLGRSSAGGAEGTIPNPPVIKNVGLPRPASSSFARWQRRCLRNSQPASYSKNGGFSSPFWHFVAQLTVLPGSQEALMFRATAMLLWHVRSHRDPCSVRAAIRIAAGPLVGCTECPGREFLGCMAY